MKLWRKPQGRLAIVLTIMLIVATSALISRANRRSYFVSIEQTFRGIVVEYTESRPSRGNAPQRLYFPRIEQAVIFLKYLETKGKVDYGWSQAEAEFLFGFTETLRSR